MDLKIYDVCRACMLKRHEDINKSTFLNMSESLQQMFTYCTSIKISVDDGLPLLICKQCTDNIHLCYNFINVCKSTDEAFKCYMGKSKQKFIKCEEIASDIVLGDDTEVKIETEDSLVDCSVDYTNFEDCNENLTNRNKSLAKKKIKKCKHKHGKLKKKRKKYKLKKHREFLSKILETSLSKDKEDCFNCPACETDIIGKSNFINHFTEEHGDYKWFTCKYCKKGFLKSNYLIQHEATHRLDRPWKCDICNKTYKQRGHLTTHMHLHTTERQFKCDKCSLQFQTKYSLALHSKLHQEDDTNLCHLCGASFAQVGNLRVHMRVHTGEKPYACSICSFRCSVQSGLKRHERMHANLKLHKCPVCQKGFNSNGSMVRHIRIHTGELPYKCDYCPKAFIDSWKRKNHLVKVHSIALETIPKMIPGRKKQYIQDKKKLECIDSKVSDESEIIKS